MRFHPQRTGRALILLGIIVLAALILPSELWPFCIGVVLIGAGLCLCRR